MTDEDIKLLADEVKMCKSFLNKGVYDNDADGLIVETNNYGDHIDIMYLWFLSDTLIAFINYPYYTHNDKVHFSLHYSKENDFMLSRFNFIKMKNKKVYAVSDNIISGNLLEVEWNEPITSNTIKKFVDGFLAEKIEQIILGDEYE